jgi:hypothetical protein
MTYSPVSIFSVHAKACFVTELGGQMARKIAIVCLFLIAVIFLVMIVMALTEPAGATGVLWIPMLS